MIILDHVVYFQSRGDLREFVVPRESDPTIVAPILAELLMFMVPRASGERATIVIQGPEKTSK